MNNNLLSTSIFLISIVLFSATSDAEEYPLLKDTNLYTKIANNCRIVDVGSWSVSLRNVFKKYKIDVIGSELCNDGKYYIFHTKLKYDPEGNTQAFYAGVYMDILNSNDDRPFSIADDKWGEVVNVSRDGGGVSVTNEFYKN